VCTSLWSFSEFDSTATLEMVSAAWPGRGEWLSPLLHKLTHFDWTLHTLVWTLPSRSKMPQGLPEGRWFTVEEALALGLPAPVRQLLAP